MDEGKKKIYRTHLDKLIQRRLFSYPFYEKTDDELITDAKEKAISDVEFCLFKLENREIKTVYVNNKFVDSKILPLFSLLDSLSKPIEIKISSFMYPAVFLSSFVDKKESKKSLLNYTEFNDYATFYRALELYYGKMVLVTTCWDLISDFVKPVKCVNIIPAPTEEDKLAYLIRKSFVRDRKYFIKDIIEKPYKYIPIYPVDNDVLNEVFMEYKSKFVEEEFRLNDFDMTLESPDYHHYDDDIDSDYDLARDNFYGMTDGLEGDFPSRYDYDNDDEL